MKLNRKKAWIYGTLMVVAILGGLWIRRVWRRAEVFEGEAPSMDALRAMESEGEEGVRNVEAFWRSGRIPQKSHAMEIIRRRCYRRNPDVLRRLRPIALSALRDVDQRIQKHAVNIVATVFPDDLPYVLPLLKDPDSLTREQSLRAVIRRGNLGYTENVLPLLDDSDPDIRILAATALRRWHGRDHGVRFNASDETVASGVARWRDWGRERGVEFGVVEAEFAAAPEKVRAVDFSLRDLDGEAFSLSDAERTVVMLYFWGRDDRGEIAGMGHLEELAGLCPERLLIVPIAVDAVPKIAVGHEDGICHQHDHHHHHDGQGRDDGGQDGGDDHSVVAAIAKHWRASGFQKRCFLDDGSASFRYVSNEVPLTVLISDGVVRRRFIGNRPSRDLCGMIDALSVGPDS